MEYLSISNKEDVKPIQEYLEILKDKSDIELVAAYNREAKIGIVGARQQIRYLLALRYELQKRFGESPVYVIDNCVVGITGIIELKNNKILIKQ